MKKSAKGFTMLDAAVGFLLLTIVIGWLVPMYTKIMLERSTLTETHAAIGILNNQLNQRVAGGLNVSGGIKKKGVTYQINWLKLNGETIRCCVSWQASDGQKHKKCGEAKV